MRDNEESTALLGEFNRNLKEIEKAFPVRIIARGETVRIEGTPAEVEQVRALFEKLLDVVETNHVPSLDEVRYLIGQVKGGGGVEGVLSDVVRVTHWGEEIRAKTVGQHRYIEAIRANDIVFSITTQPGTIGPAMACIGELRSLVKPDKSPTPLSFCIQPVCHRRLGYEIRKAFQSSTLFRG